jgi:hypothetical protein
MICSVEGCDGAARGHGYCSKHYTKWRRHGDALHSERRYHKGFTAEERFWAYVTKRRGPGACWEWNGMTFGTGYGRFHVRPGRADLAHRYSYELHIGPIPKGLNICHRCDNPLCVNPRHLFCGTHKENTADMFAKGRGRPGNMTGTANHQAKITEDTVMAIRASQDRAWQEAERYGVSVSLIHAIRQRHRWPHIE